MSNLWSANRPEGFWLCSPSLSEVGWSNAVQQALPLLGLRAQAIQADDLDGLLLATLGEGRFGPGHWKLGSVKRFYYLLKPFLPRILTRRLRRLYNGSSGEAALRENWPVDSRYVLFQWEIMRILLQYGHQPLRHRRFWPSNFRFCLALTHDVETSGGQAFVEEVADLEESLGFRSSFNFVLDRYHLDLKLTEALKVRGFEVGCHGVKHDGKLFNSLGAFEKRASRINRALKEHDMKGFRAPLTHRNPEWMQALQVEYDLSFFDTDPFEPIPGGVMSIWPFFVGHFVELPYTLVQDYTLSSILEETTPRIWLEKVDFIEKYHGMALLNSHPDYLRRPQTWQLYKDFLCAMKARLGYWHALPHEVASWWRQRSQTSMARSDDLANWETVTLQGGEVVLGGDLLRGDVSTTYLNS